MMNPTTLDALRKAAIAVVVLSCLALISYVLTIGSVNGSKMMTAFAVIVALTPILFFAAVARPIIFPFCVYIGFIPFDELLNLSRFGTVTRLLGLVSGAAIIFWLIRNKAATRPSSALLMWLALAFWMLLSTFWALDPNMTLARMATVVQLLVLYVAVSLMPIGLKELRAVLFAALIGGFAAAAYGSYYFFNNLAVVTQRLEISSGQSYIDPNQFAAALILPITIATVFALSARRFWLKIALLGVDLVLFAGVYFSGSRGSLVAIGIVFMYLFWVSRRRWQIAFVAVTAVLASLLLPFSIWGRFGNAVSSGGAGRTDIWGVGFAAFKQFWLVGAGLDNFPLAYNHAYLHVSQLAAEGWNRGPHNLLVSASTELGIIGLLLMLGAWATQYRALRGIRRDSPLYDYKLISQAVLVGLFAAAMFLDIMYTKYTWLTFMVSALTYATWKGLSVPATVVSRRSDPTYLVLKDASVQPNVPRADHTIR